MSTQENKTRSKVVEFLAKEFKLPNSQIETNFFRSTDAMGLTELGHRVMSKVFRFHQYKVEGQMLAKHYLGLRCLDYPYYLTEHWLILYNSEDTTLLELYGSATEFLEAFADGA